MSCCGKQNKSRKEQNKMAAQDMNQTHKKQASQKTVDQQPHNSNKDNNNSSTNSEANKHDQQLLSRTNNSECPQTHESHAQCSNSQPNQNPPVTPTDNSKTSPNDSPLQASQKPEAKPKTASQNQNGIPMESKSSPKPHGTEDKESGSDFQSEQSVGHKDNKNSATQSSHNIDSSQKVIDSKTSNHNVDISKVSNIKDIPADEDINRLSISQMKAMLTTEKVNFKDLTDRKEFVDKLKALWQTSQKESKSVEDDGPTCKICLSQTINCVFLECGHMMSCIDCASKIKECPICKYYITRVVRVFPN